MTLDRSAVLEVDDAAFTMRISLRVGGAPIEALARRVGHFAVLRVPQGLGVMGPNGIRGELRPFMVAHIASSTSCLDFATEERAWQFADEISRACGERLDHEPATMAEFIAAVPEVVRWVQRLSRCPAVDGDRPFAPEPASGHPSGRAA